MSDVLSPEHMALLPPEVQEALREWGPDGPAYVPGWREGRPIVANQTAGNGGPTPREAHLLQVMDRQAGRRVNEATKTICEAVRKFVGNELSRRTGPNTTRLEFAPVEIPPPTVNVASPTVNCDLSPVADAVAEAVAGLAAGLTAELRVLNQRMQVLVELLLAHAAERQRPPAWRLETLNNGERRIVPESAGE